MSPLGTGSLTVLRDLFRSLRDVTERVLADFSIETLNAVLQERAVLIARVENEYQHLTRLYGSHGWNGAPEFHEIRGHITALAACDRAATARIRERMETIRSELVSLDRSSRVARNYVRNSRT